MDFRKAGKSVLNPSLIFVVLGGGVCQDGVSVSKLSSFSSRMTFLHWPRSGDEGRETDRLKEEMGQVFPLLHLFAYTHPCRRKALRLLRF